MCASTSYAACGVSSVMGRREYRNSAAGGARDSGLGHVSGPMSDAKRELTPRWAAAAAIVALFGFALLLRLCLHEGFVLGDDREEFAVLRTLLENGPSFEGHLRYRFPMWVFNYLSELFFGSYEASFFLPTWLLSSLLPVLAFLTLRAAGYGLAGAAFAGAFVALSPFEVLIGTLRANDLFVEFFLASAFTLFVCFERRPVAQGVSVALALWLAFYAKLWSLFLYPVVGIHYLLRWVRHGERRALVAFAAASLVLHAAACAFWRIKAGTWVPFLERLSATYPVPRERLLAVLLEYPIAIFVGSEHGHTLFGAVPYLLLGSLGLAVLARWIPALTARAPRIGLDRYDKWLLYSCLVFFGLLEFFPNNFTFEEYYSVPRIFRYLAPLSFGLSLLAAKGLVDLAPLLPARRGLRSLAALAVLLLLAGGALDALAPGRSHRARVAELRAELQAMCPPVVVMERTQARFFRELHLREACPDTAVLSERSDGPEGLSERWLRDNEPQLVRDAVLVTGLPAFVYYACYHCGFRLGHFEAPLDPRWTLVQELPPADFDKEHEPVRLWRWNGRPGAAAAPALPPEQLFARGIERFDAFDYPGTRTYMSALAERFPGHELRDDAAYFLAVSYWRDQDLRQTIRGFESLIARFPASPFVGAAHYHIGLAQRALGRFAEAREAFEAAVRTTRPDAHERRYALDALASLRDPAPLPAVGRELTELLYRSAR